MARKKKAYRRIPKGAIKIDLPNTTQAKDWTCGPSALLAICGYYGVGPEKEKEVVADMKATDKGTDPIQIVRTARGYGLKVEEFRPMEIDELLGALQERRPVMLMIQAWADVPRSSYRNDWDDGHWVVAIGYDMKGVYFEDPSLHNVRGFLTYQQLDDRWHDIEGQDEHHVERYGAVIWKNGDGKCRFYKNARVID
jgi:predicted double-glycine peptidase